MEIWILMWMLQGEGGSKYYPHSLEVIGPKSVCENKARRVRRFYGERKIKYGNMYCTKKEEQD